MQYSVHASPTEQLCKLLVHYTLPQYYVSIYSQEMVMERCIEVYMVCQIAVWDVYMYNIYQ